MSATNSNSGTKHHVVAIDGLRTLAVLSVMAFHFGLPLYGGFIGVDSFFVLSGFLITSLLIKDIDRHGHVQLALFWVRRIRRLIPAMLFMVVSVIIWTLFFESLTSRLNLGTDVQATLAYYANWHFISHSSYFANDGSVSPLLHMWSLAVEEQFYIVWPVVIALVAFSKSRRKEIILGLSSLIAICSACWMAHLWIPGAPERAYMGTDSRAFQLALGAMLAAFVSLRPNLRTSSRLRSTFSAVALMTLTASCFLMGNSAGPTTTYVHGGAVLVGLSAALLIWSMWAGSSRVARFFELAPMTYLGRISYAMYLWHWPLQVFVHHRLPTFTFSQNYMQALILTALTIGFAAMSYHLIETPLRTRGPLVRSKSWKILIATPMVLLATVFISNQALASIQTDPLPNGNNKIIMLVGDSVPMRLTDQFDAYAATKGWHVINAATGMCAAITIKMSNPDGTLFGDTKTCLATKAKQQYVIDHYKPAITIWMSRYEIADRYTSTGRHISPTSETFWSLNTKAMQDRVAMLNTNNAPVVLVPIERSGVGMLSRCKPTRCHWYLNRLISATGISYQNKWNAILYSEAKSNPLAKYFSINKLVCHNSKSPCNDLVNGVTVRSDGTHYSTAGGKEFIPQLVDFAIVQGTAAAQLP